MRATLTAEQKKARAEERAAKQAMWKASDDRIKKAHEETRAVVAANTCPTCGGSVKRNMSLTGWWQCSQFGSEQFRKDPTKPACSWQGFTE